MSALAYINVMPLFVGVHGHSAKLKAKSTNFFVYKVSEFAVPRKLSQSLFGFKHNVDEKGACADQYYKQAYGWWPQ